MNRQLDQAFAKLKTLPDEQQQEAAELLLIYLESRESGTWLTPDQIAEIERGLSEDEPFATDEEVKAVFDRLTK